MKKIFFLSALLCASVMANAAKMCDVPTGHLNNPEFGDTNGRILLSIEPTGNANEYKLTIKPNAEGNKLDVLYAIIGSGATTNPYPITAGSDVATGGEDELSATFTYTGGVNTMTIQWSHPGWDGRWECTLPDLDLSKLKSCASTGKEDPKLTLNQTEVTLDASTSETFQIIATKEDGAGAISYTSDKPGIASVSNTGVITAIGRGIAVITVTVAETEDYDDAEETVTVIVTGPINWDAIEYLSGSRYKVVVEPEIASTFGGMHIEAGPKLWVGFPSADFGACSIEMSVNDGAWRTFALSQLPNKYNSFTVVCGGTTYTFYVFYADGTETPTAIDNAAEAVKAQKVVENGQLIIIKNGIRYNVAGQVVK